MKNNFILSEKRGKIHTKNAKIIFICELFHNKYFFY